MDMNQAPVKRECGLRVPGGVYLEVKTGSNGKPIESFLIDPPMIPEVEVPHQGIAVLGERDGILYLIDHVGSNNYPDVATFIEETRHQGLSRRIPSSFPFEVLDKPVILLLAHDRAWVTGYAQYTQHTCPCQRKDHLAAGSAMCVGIYNHDLTPRAGDAIIKEDETGVWVKRTLEGGAVMHGIIPNEAFSREYVEAAFLWLPIGNLAIVRDPENPDRYQQTLEKTRKATLPIEEVNE